MSANDQRILGLHFTIRSLFFSFYSKLLLNSVWSSQFPIHTSISPPSDAELCLWQHSGKGESPLILLKSLLSAVWLFWGKLLQTFICCRLIFQTPIRLWVRSPPGRLWKSCVPSRTGCTSSCRAHKWQLCWPDMAPHQQGSCPRCLKELEQRENRAGAEAIPLFRGIKWVFIEGHTWQDWSHGCGSARMAPIWKKKRVWPWDLTFL